MLFKDVMAANVEKETHPLNAGLAHTQPVGLFSALFPHPHPSSTRLDAKGT